MNINLSLGVDGISLFFLLLTTLLMPLCLLASWNSVKIYVKEYFIAFLIMESLLIVVFSAMDLLLFYIFFESDTSFIFLVDYVKSCLHITYILVEVRFVFLHPSVTIKFGDIFSN